MQRLVKDYGRQPPERVIYVMLQICGSLSEAHHKGIVHRDVRPANVMITAQSGLYDTVKLLDFGLVKEVDSDSTMLTVSDSLTGTPTYMSP
ncbi:protein kinase domain-containing protein, partial [Streptococcus pyogenes]